MIRDSDLVERLLAGDRPESFAAASVPALIAQVGDPGDGDAAAVALALGLLAELAGGDAELCAALADGVDTYLARLAQAPDDEPLRLALLFLLAHFPARAAAILAAIAPLPLAADDRSRLECCLDPSPFAAGRCWPSPTTWERAPAGARGPIAPPAQLERIVELETQALLAYSGAKAVAAIRGEVR